MQNDKINKKKILKDKALAKPSETVKTSGEQDYANKIIKQKAKQKKKKTKFNLKRIEF